MAQAALHGPRRWKTPGTPRTRIAAAALVVAALGIGLAQGHGSSPNSLSSSSGATAASLPAKAEDRAAAGAAPQALQGAVTAPTTTGATAGAADAAAPGVDVGPQVVRTGTVELTAPAATVPGLITAASAVAASFQGAVSDSKTSESGTEPSGTVTLRIPSARTDDAIAALRGLGHVTAVSTGSTDVTGQVVDLGARLTALQDSHERYLDLLGHAGTIAEILQVQQHIDGVQTQIEQLQGQQKALADQTSLSTITVTVLTKDAANVTPAVHHRTGFSKAWHDAGGDFSDGFQALVAASGTAAFLLICAGVAGFVWVGARRVMRGRTAH